MLPGRPRRPARWHGRRASFSSPSGERALRMKKAGGGAHRRDAGRRPRGPGQRGQPHGNADGKRQQVRQPARPACQEAGRAQAEGQGDGLQGQGDGQGQEPGRQGRQGPVRRACVRGRGPDPYAARPVRRRAATHDHGAAGTINHGGTAGPLHNQIPQPNRAVDNTTIWAPDFSQAYYENLLYDKDAIPSMANFYLEQSSGPIQRRRLRQRLGPGPEQRGRVWQQLLRQHRLHARHRAVPRGPGRCLVERTRRRQDRSARSTPCLRRSTSGIATTTTSTATSTSPTATSTTSSPSTPVRARRLAAAPRARRHLEPPLVRQRRFPAPQARRSQATRRAAASDRLTATTGSATTPSSRRTAASASSRTSSAMTSACPTSTTPAVTPVAPRTAPAGGRHGRRARTAP